jgi:UDP-N-acetylmuramate--alanine ligase
LELQMPGDHNALNSTAAVAVAHELGLSDDSIRKGLTSFAGVKRRFTRTGEHNGVIVFDDYGHHPVEIAAVLSAARKVTKGKVVAVMQPHRYTRLASLFNEFCSCFNDADSVILAPVYAAGETPIEGATHTHLAEGLHGRGHRSVSTIESPEELAALVRGQVSAGDIVVCLGAGTITQWAYALPGQLAALDGKGSP